jgi:hypothetical protein
MDDEINPQPFNIVSSTNFISSDSDYRVYLEADELDFIRVSADSIWMIGADPIGLLLDKLIFNRFRISKQRKHIFHIDRINNRLDRIYTDKYNFRLTISDILESRIDKTLFVRNSMISGIKARWTLKYRVNGRLNALDFFFATNEDLSAAIPLLESSIGDRHQTLIEWNAKKRKFVGKKKLESSETIDPFWNQGSS